MEKYLPSKKFVYVMIVITTLGIIIFLIFNFSTQKKFFFFSKEKSSLVSEQPTLNELVGKDTDGDGVTDWEESLWGTDPKNKITFDGIPDTTYIKNKRVELKTDTDTSEKNILTETDKFARQFFASYAAMKTSGQTDDSTLSSFSDSLEQRITDPTILDQYTEKDIKLKTGDESKDQETYYTTAAKLFETYKNKGVGDEMDIASVMANSENEVDTQNQDKLYEISLAYKEFAKKLLLVSVPESLASYHLRIINSANNTGIAVGNMSKMLVDPIVGISGTSQYQKYCDNLVSSVNDLEAFLSINGIITE